MELLQVFDENKNMLNEYIKRDLKKTLTDGKHFMIILLFIENNGKFLIQKTSIKKNSEYATTGGHATFKDNSIDTVIKEAKEELNIDFKEYELEFIKCIDYRNCFCDIYYTNKIIDDKDIILQEEEVESIEWLSISEIEDLIEKGMFRKGNIEPFKYILEYKNSLLCRIMNDNYINNIINKINDVILVDNCGDHGMNHALRVMKYVEILLIGNSASEKEIELGKIAAYLHDIGAIDGKKNHAIRSSEFVDYVKPQVSGHVL